MSQYPAERDRHPVPTPDEMTRTHQAGWTQPEHGASGRLLHPHEQNAHEIEGITPGYIDTSDEGYRDAFGDLFDEHLHIFFTNYINNKRRVANAVPIFSGATTLGIYGRGYILGYSLQGVTGKLATISDNKQGTNLPILSVGFDARGTNTEMFATPLLFEGQLVAALNDASIQGVLYIEQVVSD